jgi:predicted amidophosphoribosyltransferase
MTLLTADLCLCCPSPRSGAAVFCTDCLSDLRLRFRARHQVPTVVNQTPVYSCFEYGGVVQKLIAMLKSQPFGLLPSGAWDWLQSLAAFWSPSVEDWKSTSISFVPRRPWASITETELSSIWAKCVSEATGLPRKPSLLVPLSEWGRTAQKQLSRQQRLSQQIHFGVSQPTSQTTPKAQSVLLLDDVCTTGATVGAGIRALQNHGHRVQHVLVLALVER